MADTLAGLGPITTVRLRLDPLMDADVQDICRITDHPEIIHRVDFLESPFTLEDAAELVARNRGGAERMLGIQKSDDRTLIGVIGAHLHGENEIEIGYWLGREFHGQGYASEAVAALVAALQRAFPHRQIIAECDPENRASWRVLTKASFAATGEAGLRRGRRRLALRCPTG